MEKNSRIFVAGHKGLVGSAICRRLRQEGFDNLLLRTRQQLDLRDQAATRRFFAEEKPEGRVYGRRQGGRDTSQHHLPGRFHSRQPGGGD